MQRSFWVFLFMVGSFLTGCVRSASRSKIGTATEAIFQPITPASDAVVFPLNFGTTWIYDYSAHFDADEATWSVTDTVLVVNIRDGFLIAEVEQDVMFKEGDASRHYSDAPMNGRFWYLFDDVHLYKLDYEPDPVSVANAWLELVFPLGSICCWFPDAQQRDEARGATPVFCTAAGCRSVSGEPHTVEVPAGKFEVCLDVVTFYNSGSTFLTFCPGIGTVATRSNPSGTQFGYHSALTGYILPTSDGTSP